MNFNIQTIIFSLKIKNIMVRQEKGNSEIKINNIIIYFDLENCKKVTFMYIRFLDFVILIRLEVFTSLLSSAFSFVINQKCVQRLQTVGIVCRVPRWCGQLEGIVPESWCLPRKDHWWRQLGKHFDAIVVDYFCKLHAILKWKIVYSTKIQHNAHLVENNSVSRIHNLQKWLHWDDIVCCKWNR